MLNPHVLEQELKDSIRGEVRFDAGARALYATDSSNYRQVPIGVVIPRDVSDVIQTVALAKAHNAPILNRGGGTSLAGQCCNVAVIMDMSKYLHEILELSPTTKQARVQPGVVLDSLRDAAEEHHLTFGPDPATHNHCTLGGMMGNNSCGVHSVMSGKTDDNVEELDILTYRGLRMKVGKTSDEELQAIISGGGPRGEIYSRLKSLRDRYAERIRQKFPNIPRCVSGYNLPHLLPENGFHVARALIGSESTCVTILEAKLRLVHSPPGRSLVVLGYPDVYMACDRVMEILEFKPIGLEGFDDIMVKGMHKKNLHTEKIALLPEGGGWLLVEFGGEDKAGADAKARAFAEKMNASAGHPNVKVFSEKTDAAKVWKVRESALGAVSNVPGQKHSWEGWEDSAVHPSKVGYYLRELRDLYNKYEYQGAFYGHFGEGCIHTRITFDFESKDGVRNFRSFMQEAADLVIGYGGSVSGEHGDGQARGELLPKMFGEELMQAFREFKAIWDPDGKMNPGKVIDANKLDENLRMGDGYKPKKVPTNFSFISDEGKFGDAASRCVGVGECRREQGGTMCPSYRATMEEKHSTRGRARMLFEMMQGDVIKDGWKSEEVKEALELCLACKGCKTECPVNVDMATYKAEFLSHYYEGKARPMAAYTMGLIHRWARIGSLIPGLANFLTQNPLTGGIMKSIAGIARERHIPKFAARTFRDWFKNRLPLPPLLRKEGKKRPPLNPLLDEEGKRETTQRVVSTTARKQVVLWADTFNNHFRTETAIAAVEVLEYVGYEVIVPPGHLCCGRPLYDYGMLDTAKKQLVEILATMKPWIDQGIPIVGLEPSCVAVFRDEMVNLFPDHEDAKRMRDQTLTLSEFLELKVKDYSFPPVKKKIAMQTHCHEKAVMRPNAEIDVLKRLGMDVQALDAGCCGMAGSFGFRAEHYEVSRQVGELGVLPALRALDKDTMILADGFSCREQVEQGTGRRAYHLAEVLRLSINLASGQVFPSTKK